MNAVYQVRNLRAGYRRQAILTDVTLTIQAGELWCFLGPNGHGKTTLLHTIMGALRPLGGQLTVDHDLAGARHRAYVPQHNRMQDTLPLTVREFVETGLVGLGRLAVGRPPGVACTARPWNELGHRRTSRRHSFHASLGRSGTAGRAGPGSRPSTPDPGWWMSPPTTWIPTTEQVVRELLRQQHRDQRTPR